MIKAAIEGFIYSQWDKSSIKELKVEINEYNRQVEKIEVIFKEDIWPDYNGIGPVLESVNKYTQADEYGDLTEADVKITTFFHNTENDDCGDLVKITFNFNIDS